MDGRVHQRKVLHGKDQSFHLVLGPASSWRLDNVHLNLASQGLLEPRDHCCYHQLLGERPACSQLIRFKCVFIT